ncbi:MAG: 4-hydroxy-2-ketovalerate aldolase, partial [Lachnospiraceae bacterium]|nr:4-hydroxy-2-ketovalerate aldolase [Lachnospiraceae bacterium]
MGKIELLDCTLRDGGYINNWQFSEDGIKGILKKLANTGIEMIEMGFLKGSVSDPDISLFPDTRSCDNILLERDPGVRYVAM